MTKQFTPNDEFFWEVAEDLQSYVSGLEVESAYREFCIAVARHYMGPVAGHYVLDHYELGSRMVDGGETPESMMVEFSALVNAIIEQASHRDPYVWPKDQVICHCCGELSGYETNSEDYAFTDCCGAEVQ